MASDGPPCDPKRATDNAQDHADAKASNGNHKRDERKYNADRAGDDRVVRREKLNQPHHEEKPAHQQPAQIILPRNASATNESGPINTRIPARMSRMEPANGRERRQRLKRPQFFQSSAGLACRRVTFPLRCCHHTCALPANCRCTRRNNVKRLLFRREKSFSVPRLLASFCSLSSSNGTSEISLEACSSGTS